MTGFSPGCKSIGRFGSERQEIVLPILDHIDSFMAIKPRTSFGISKKLDHILSTGIFSNGFKVRSNLANNVFILQDQNIPPSMLKIC
ncbi:hypothetical protein OPQ81_003835 [Rhizoctonia solani]|nr:hypothetical protein OPQ81_003835 [Rhizoctonia solani]